MKVWIVIGNYGDGYECAWTKNLDVFENEESAKKFKDLYDSNPDIKYYKELIRKKFNVGDEIYDDEKSPNPKVIGYIEDLTEEEKVKLKSLPYDKYSEYDNYQNSYIEEWEVKK